MRKSLASCGTRFIVMTVPHDLRKYKMIKKIKPISSLTAPLNVEYFCPLQPQKTTKKKNKEIERDRENRNSNWEKSSIWGCWHFFNCEGFQSGWMLAGEYVGELILLPSATQSHYHLPVSLLLLQSSNSSLCFSFLGLIYQSTLNAKLFLSLSLSLLFLGDFVHIK